jgi:serine/threonine protein kinase
MSSVYLLEHGVLLKRFVLKVLHPFYARRRDLVERARIEAQAIAQLRHPHVVEVFDFWFGEGETPCIVLELLEGRTLAKELDRVGRLPPLEAIALSRQALSALDAAHRIGIVHRDVKPENLFLHAPPARGTTLKVLDFGLARVLPDATAALAPAPLAVPTATGMVIGTLRYMSPEASRGERVGPPADIFSLGMVLYTMLTGRTPFTPEVARAEPPSRVIDLRGLAELDDVVLRALAPVPEDRFPSAAEFRRELKRVVAGAPA